MNTVQCYGKKKDLFPFFFFLLFLVSLHSGRKSKEEEEQKGIAFRNMLEAYEALRSDDKGSRAKTTKEGFLYSILTFLEKQGLIEYVEEDEMVKTSKKLDNLMDWNLLNQNNYQRVRKVLEHE